MPDYFEIVFNLLGRIMENVLRISSNPEPVLMDINEVELKFVIRKNFNFSFYRLHPYR